MKNFTKKLALLLVFAMVLGVVTPTSIAKAADLKISIDFKNLVLYVKDGDTAKSGFDFTQVVSNTAPTNDALAKLKDKDWYAVDEEDGTATVADISWFNKKKASYAVARVWDNTKKEYNYIVSDKIDAAEADIKVLYSDKAAGAANGTKTPAFTAGQSVGSPKTGYFVFYRGKGNDMKVVTPSFISFRVDGTYTYDQVLKDNDTFNYTTGGKNGSKTFIDALSRAMNGKGATFLFTQAKGSSQVTSDKDQVGWPSAKEAKYKFVGKKTAPTVKLGVDHLVPLKSGQEYRIVDASDTSKKSDWVAVDDYHVTETNGKKKVNKVYLEDLIVTGSGITGNWVADKKLTATALATGNVKLQVRTAASAKGVASKIYSAVVSMKAIDANVSSTASIAYTVPYDKTKGVTIKNTSGKDIEYTLTATTAAVLAGKWKSIKADKDVKLKDKDLKDQKYILVRVAGDKKAGVIASDYKPTVIADLVVTPQNITEVAANTNFEAVEGAKYQVTTAGAVTVTIPKSAVSGKAIEAKSVEVTVSGVTNPGTLKWASKGSNKNFTIDVPTYASNKVTFKFAVKKDATGDSGEYKCAVEGLNFTFKVVIANN